METRRFNVTGVCVPDKHYMVDISGKVRQIRAMIDQGLYFTINRGRQYGKTTTINALCGALADDYICVWISLEGLGRASFETEEAFCPVFLRLVQRALHFTSVAGETAYIERWMDPSVKDFVALNDHLSTMCEGRKIVLMIDEADAFISLRTYLSFLGLLRDKYLKRSTGRDFTFQSVILAGVVDIRNIKMKMIKEGIYTPAAQENTDHISPWNIAAPFDVDMSFHPAEIATMLSEYEADHHTGMDIAGIAEEIYRWTSGYPFLVSRICMLIDGSAEKKWNNEGIFHAVKLLLDERNTLFDDIFKNMEMYQDLYDYVYDILIRGAEKAYSPYNPTLSWALMFCFLKVADGKVLVHNRVFELCICDYFMSREDDRSRRQTMQSGVLKHDVVREGRFDMELALRKFARHFRTIYTERDADFFERHGRLLFLSYLAPLINGDGFYHIESQLTNLQRMDIVVNYGRDEFVIELKLWRGETAREDALTQLAGYLAGRGASAGYLVTFDLRQEPHRTPKEEWVEAGPCRIFDVVL
ncbi:MAG: hypothetical protein LBR16_06825 [Treponema sp.]|jgi:hypothetical protein|nr:hypothetical protein [Treponema sp.]